MLSSDSEKQPSDHADGSDNDHHSAKTKHAIDCIELCLLNQSFRPEYVHQLFPNETIPGYQPLRGRFTDNIPRITSTSARDKEGSVTTTSDALETATRNTPIEATGKRSDDDKDPTLLIRIRLAPSCRRCHLHWFILPVVRPSSRDGTLPLVIPNPKSTTADGNKDGKRPIPVQCTFLDDGNTKYRKVTQSQAHHDHNSTFGTISFHVDRNGGGEDLHSVELPASATEQHDDRHRMSREEIQERLALALPPIADDMELVYGEEQEEKQQLGDSEDGYLQEPVGYVIEEYHCHKVGSVFCLALANGSDAVHYHDHVQRLALFYIECASTVNVAEGDTGNDPPVGGSWKVLYLFRKHGDRRYSFAGYMTLYHFSSPFRKPVPGIVVRVCQALILPPYQHAGHGQRMLHRVHDWADGLYNDEILRNQSGGAASSTRLLSRDIVEINVEDPAPAFTAVRCLVDFQRCCQQEWFGPIQYEYASRDPDEITQPKFFDYLRESEAARIAIQAKITSRQVQVVYELYKLYLFRQACAALGLSSGNPIDKDEYEKRYRIMVKKRLQLENKADISACRSKVEMQQFLGKLFDETYVLYVRILTRCEG